MVDLEKADPDFFARGGAYTKQINRDVYPAIDPTSPSLSQKGKVVIITGAGSGFGARGIVPAFAKAGAKAVVLVGRRPEKLQESAAAVHKASSSVELLQVPADVSKLADVKKLFETVKGKFGHVDVLINNAGVMSGPGPIAASDPVKWWTDMQVNTQGTFLMIQAFLEAVGEGGKGTIINISSGASTTIIPGMSSYGISKLAINRFGEYLAVEAPGVSCVTLDPGTVKTDMVPPAFEKFARDTPELVGGMCCWLSTPQAEFLKGRFIMANWNVDELLARKDEIVNGGDLKMTLQGKFGVAA